jgi:hypothetical protein
MEQFPGGIAQIEEWSALPVLQVALVLRNTKPFKTIPGPRVGGQPGNGPA